MINNNSPWISGKWKVQIPFIRCFFTPKSYIFPQLIKDLLCHMDDDWTSVRCTRISTCTGRGRLTHAGRVTVGIGGLLRKLLLRAAFVLVGVLFVLDEDLSQKVHGTGQSNGWIQLRERRQMFSRFLEKMLTDITAINVIKTIKLYIERGQKYTVSFAIAI